MSLFPKQLARMLQNRATSIKAVTSVSALQDGFGDLGKSASAFYVHDNDGGILRVVVLQYKEPLR